MSASVLGPLHDDPIGKLIGSPFMRFESPLGIHGLAVVTDSRLDLLAVLAVKRGSWGKFIEQAQREFSTICLLEVMNGAFGERLKMAGFEEFTEFHVRTKEMVTGLRWDAAWVKQAVQTGELR